MRARPSVAVVLGVLLGGALMVGAPAGGCGPVVAPAEPPEVSDAGDAGDATVDICQRPGAPAVCEAGVPEPADASTTSCRGGKADGLCEPLSEGCGCVDCADLARCTGRCVDDGVCRRGGAAGGAGSGGAAGASGTAGASGETGIAGGAGPSGSSGQSGQAGTGQVGDGLDEDCSCDDCDGKVEGCVPEPIGCHTNGVCSALEDDCACPDCRDDRDCEACVDNGYCARYTEGCACADCAAVPECQAITAP